MESIQDDSLRFFDFIGGFGVLGFTFMSTLMASSKLNGWSETGLAFGMIGPPMASGVEHSSLGTSSEHASAAACSAFCYDIREDVWIIPVVMAIRKLRQIKRQIGFADLMECTHHTTLQKAPEAVQVRRMDIPAQHTRL